MGNNCGLSVYFPLGGGKERIEDWEKEEMGAARGIRAGDMGLPRVRMSQLCGYDKRE